MKLKMFAVYDSKAEAYLQPFFLHQKGEAVRTFQDAANDPQSMICKHAADYTLFEIGEYDSSNAHVEQLSAHISLGNALEFRNA